MKKIILGMLFMVSAAAMAKTPRVAANEAGARVAFNPDDRVQIFEPTRNSITVDGQIVICPMNMEAHWRDSVCLDANKKNAWQLLANSAPPGYQVVSYEFRFIGVGHRTLIVYYGKK